MQPVPQSPTPAPSNHDGLKSILSTLILFIAAPLIALSITTFIFQSYEVDGPSMQQTLQDNDRLIVLKLPKTLTRLTGRDYVPPRGTIIVFAKQGMYDFENNKEKQLIKRVIGLPGERVVVTEGTVTVYNSEHPEGFNPDSGAFYPGLLDTTPGEADITVDEGELFVLGDNRHDSQDSRSFGTITSEEVVGKLVLRIMPFNKARTY